MAIHGSTLRKLTGALGKERLRAPGGRPPYVLQTSLL